MPQMDGFAFCRACKRDEQLQKIPFVFYTATYKDQRDKELAMQLGAARFIIKPIDMDELVTVLNEVIEEFSDQVHEPAQTFVEPNQILDEGNNFYRMYWNPVVAS